MNLRRFAGYALVAVASALAFASCFVPDQYEAEIRITKLGAYGISYTGVLTNAPFFSEYARGKIKDGPETQKTIKLYGDQLKRDSSFKEVNSLGRGRFQVKYYREGRFFGAHQMVTFISRQAPVFRLRTTEEGNFSVGGSGAGRQYASKLEAVGMTTQGLFRIVTDAEVLEHNAQFVRKSPTPGYTMYDWKIRNFRDVPPRLIAKLAIDPKTGGEPTNVEKDTSGAGDAELDALAKKRK